VTFVTPHGIQIAYSEKKGGNIFNIDGSNNYINYKLKTSVGTLDARYIPINGSNAENFSAYGDYNSSLRFLVSPRNWEAPILPGINGKIQGDFQYSRYSGLQIGGRATAETLRVGTFSIEATIGIKYI
jgi:hypothetical protein